MKYLKSDRTSHEDVLKARIDTYQSLVKAEKSVSDAYQSFNHPQEKDKRKEGARQVNMEHRNTATVLFETGLVTLVMVLSFLGNLMVCHAIRRNPRLRCPSNYYLISLALTDIFQAVLVMPLSVFLLAMGRWPFGTPMCYVSAITKLSLSKTSLLTMALMALNRYYKIVRPASYQSIFTKRFIVITASAAWVTMVLMSLIFAFASDSRPQEDMSFAVCRVSFGQFVSVVLIIMYLPYFVIGFCYWKIYRVVRMHNANISWQSANVEHVKITKTLLVTIVGFAILWVPAHAVFVAFLFELYVPHQLKFMVTFFVFTSSCVNPFIYGFMNRAFRHEFKKILTTRNNPIASDSGSAQN